MVFDPSLIEVGVCIQGKETEFLAIHLETGHKGVTIWLAKSTAEKDESFHPFARNRSEVGVEVEARNYRTGKPHILLLPANSGMVRFPDLDLTWQGSSERSRVYYLAVLETVPREGVFARLAPLRVPVWHHVIIVAGADRYGYIIQNPTAATGVST